MFNVTQAINGIGFGKFQVRTQTNINKDKLSVGAKLLVNKKYAWDNKT